jgi:hypothetical protein
MVYITTNTISVRTRLGAVVHRHSSHGGRWTTNPIRASQSLVTESGERGLEDVIHHAIAAATVSAASIHAGRTEAKAAPHAVAWSTRA